jgi:hypothetical protein
MLNGVKRNKKLSADEQIARKARAMAAREGRGEDAAYIAALCHRLKAGQPPTQKTSTLRGHAPLSTKKAIAVPGYMAKATITLSPEAKRRLFG